MLPLEIDLFYALICIAVSSFFGVLTLVIVLALGLSQQSKIIKEMWDIKGISSVSISGQDNKYEE